MSCTVMYQPYAMSYSSSSCERTNSSLDKAPSPPDSLLSDTSSYNSPGPIITIGTGGNGPGSVGSGSTPIHSSLSSTRRPISPSIPLSTNIRSSSSGGSSSNHNHSSNRAGTSSSSRHDHDARIYDATGGGSGGGRNTASPIPSTSQQHHNHNHHHHHPHLHHNIISSNQSNRNNNISSSSSSNANNNGGSSGSGSSSSSGSNSQKAQYVSQNCVVFVHYNGDVSRVVDEHFTRALATPYTNEKPNKCLPMSTRNFPPSFWNSNYQPSKPLASYGADFYGAAVDYGTPLAGLAHHHQGDPWHYPLPPPHQSYHARTTEIPYPPMPSTSRFNAAQYGSFLLAGAAASSGAGRFTGVMPGTSQCGMKANDTTAAWAAGGRYHPHHHHHHHHESLSDLHLADYSAAAAAHYSTMTAGLETSAQESTSKDLYWF